MRYEIYSLSDLSQLCDHCDSPKGVMGTEQGGLRVAVSYKDVDTDVKLLFSKERIYVTLFLM